MARSLPKPLSKRLVFENDYVEGLAISYKRNRDFGTYVRICKHTKNLIDSIILGSRFNRTVPFHDLVSHLFLQMERWILKWVPGMGTIYSYFSTCTAGDTLVWLADGRKMKISEIVDNQLDVEVLSLNTATGQVERGKVVSWFKREAQPEDWDVLVARPSGSKVIRNVVTKDHRMWTSQGYKKSRDLCDTDELVSLRQSVTDEGVDAFCGLWLGDGHISPRGHLTVAHGNPQKEYAAYIARKFGVRLKTREGMVKVPTSDVKKPYTIHTINWKMQDEVDFMREPTVASALARLSPLGLALWYCDDGNTRNVKPKRGRDGGYFYARLHTESFDDAERTAMINWFQEKWGIQWGTWARPNTDGSVLVCRESEKFFRLIAPFVPACMAYKIPEEFRVTSSAIDDAVFVSWTTKRTTVRKKSGQNRKNTRCDLTYRYDIEVEGNHNFFASMSEEGSSVCHSNCIKHGSYSLLAKENQLRQRQVLAGDTPLESLGASYTMDFSGERDLVERVRAGVHTRWADPEVQEAIQYVVEEILASGGIRNRKAVVRTLEHAFDLGVHCEAGLGRHEPVEVAKFIVDWSSTAVRQAWLDHHASPVTAFDIVRLQSRYSFLPDLVSCIGTEAASKLMGAFAGVSLRIPTLAAWEKVKQVGQAYDEYMEDPGPEVVRTWAKKLRVSEDRLLGTIESWSSNAQAGVLEDVPLAS